MHATNSPPPALPEGRRLLLLRIARDGCHPDSPILSMTIQPATIQYYYRTSILPKAAQSADATAAVTVTAETATTESSASKPRPARRRSRAGGKGKGKGKGKSKGKTSILSCISRKIADDKQSIPLRSLFNAALDSGGGAECDDDDDGHTEETEGGDGGGGGGGRKPSTRKRKRRDCSDPDDDSGDDDGACPSPAEVAAAADPHDDAYSSFAGSEDHKKASASATVPLVEGLNDDGAEFLRRVNNKFFTAPVSSPLRASALSKASAEATDAAPSIRGRLSEKLDDASADL